MAKVVSSKKQLEKLVSLMEANPDIAKGICGKALAKKRWEKFTAELNSLGPPMRTCDKWIKVWADLKFKIKKKKTENKTEIQATGGGPNRLHQFSNLEESVMGLLSMDASIDPPGLEIGLEIPDSMKNNENDINKDNMEVEEDLIHIDVSENFSSENSTRVRSSEKKRTNKTKEDERIALLMKQTDAQEDFYNEYKATMKDLKRKIGSFEEYSKKSYYLKKDKHKELLAIKREKLQLYKDELNCKQKYRAAKLKLLQQKLELKKSEIDLKLSKI